MLVIATSMPDEREWIQWKGRTARQDRPGQYYVLLDRTQPPFDRRHRGLASKLTRLPSDQAKVDALLRVADEGMASRLKEFKSDQARGEKLNQLAIAYYRMHPRSADDPWPCSQHWDSDVAMRNFLDTPEVLMASPADITRRAKKLFGISI